MAFQGEYFIERYGAKAAEATPPIGKMLKAGIPVGAGTDATRVASYNPWVSLNWLVTGKTVGGTRLYPPANRVDREEALRLWTTANTWFSNEEGKKGQIAVGQLADLAVLSDDYMTVPEDEIPHLSSVLTLLGGKVVHGRATIRQAGAGAAAAHARLVAGAHLRRLPGSLARPRPRPGQRLRLRQRLQRPRPRPRRRPGREAPTADARSFWGAMGCGCWAV
jgi:cytosine/adenosine deaminase-related metal-dependent hydrolase